MSDPKASDQLCPRCGGDLRRVPRRSMDRLISILVQVRRYECRSPNCQWQGTLRVRRAVERKEPTLKADE